MSQGERRTRQRHDLRKLVGVLMGVSAASTAMAQTVPTNITIDSSFGRTSGQVGPSANNTTVTGNRGATYNVNNLYTIAESQGRTAGANLFHSFATFNVGAGDAAVFQTTTPALQNIIARVSGPSASTIQGLLAVNAAADSAPNFFFINPAGVTFGVGAQVDVPAAFHVSTANELRFADGTTFKAGSGPDSSMTMAAPEAFGFIGGSGEVAFNGVHADLLADEAPFVAKSFDVTAAAVSFVDSSISLPEAQVRIVGTGVMAGNIPLEGVPTGALQGDVRLTRSRLDVMPDSNDDPGADGAPIPIEDFPIDAFPTDDDAPILFPTDDAPIVFPTDGLPSENPTSSGTAVRTGSLTLAGRDIVLDDAGLSASRLSDGTIRVRAAGNVTLTGNTRLLAEVGAAGGRSGTIDVLAQGAIDVVGGSNEVLFSTAVSVPDVSAVAPGGGIALRGESVNVRRATFDATFQSSVPVLIDTFTAPSDTSAPRQPTAVSIQSNSFITLEDTQIAGDSSLQANAPGGGILLQSLGAGDIVVRDSIISNQAFLLGSASPIQIDTAGDVQLFDSVVSSETLGGATGSINLRGDEIALRGQSFVTVDLGAIDFGTPARVGSVTLEATSRVVVEANSTIAARSGGEAPNPEATPRGQIRISAPRLEIDGQITTEALGNLAANDIVIDGGSTGLTIQGAGVITSSSTATTNVGGGSADAGPTLGDDAANDGRRRPFLGIGGVIDFIAGGPPSGDAGAITVQGSDVAISGVRLSSSSTADSSGNAGSIQVTAGNNLIVSGAQLQTDTAGAGQAGSIVINSGGQLTISDMSVLTSSTSGSGNAGNIDINGTDTSLTGVMLNSASTSDSSGNAGTVTLRAADSLALADATVRTDTAGSGKAGNITLTASTISLDPSLISSQSASGSSGQTGTIDVTATDSIELRDSTVSIANAARVDDPSMTPLGRIRLNAPDVKLFDSNVTAQSSANVTASGISIASDKLMIRRSNVTTSAQDGNGGNIDVVGQRFTVLDKSQISTSVLGTQSGSGGDITVRSNVLVVNTSFIQANTAASGASGGNVIIAVGQLLPVGVLVTGGDVPLLFDPLRNGLSAIQAAAPDGLSGTIQLAGPSFDLVGNLQGVAAEFVATGPLGQDLCKRSSTNSLTQVGRGGLRPLSTGLLRPDTALPLLPELPALSLHLDAQAPSTVNCGH